MKNYANLYSLILSFTLCAFLFACTPTIEDNTDISDEISKVNQFFMSAVSNGDAAGVADVYTEDGQFLLPNAEKVVGKANIQKTFQGLIDSGITGLKLESVEIERTGDTAYEVGRYNLYAGDAEVDNGKYIVIWKKEGAEWKYYRDIFNSDLPIPVPETVADEGEET